MPRRKDSFLEGLVVLPWPVGAVAGVVVLVAGLWVLPAILAGSSNPFLAAFAKGADAFAPLVVIVALGCWAAAVVSALRRAQRRKLLDTRSHLESLRSLSWRELESLVAEAYQRKGFQVEENLRGGADGGVDLRLRRNGELTLVQCKHWRTQRVGAPIVREQLGLLTHHGANAVIIVSVGDFTAEARAFADGKPIELVAGPELLALVREVQANPPPTAGSPAPKRVSVPAPAPAPAPAHDASEALPCPRCGSAMVRRVARQTGGAFLGCSRYPACRGTRAI